MTSFPSSGGRLPEIGKVIILRGREVLAPISTLEFAPAEKTSFSYFCNDNVLYEKIQKGTNMINGY